MTILLLNRLGFSHNHHQSHRHMSEVNLAYLQAFRSLVSQNLKRALESFKLGSEFLSLKWIRQCFQMVPIIHNGFAKLMVEIDYPVSSWEAGSIDDYLDYTINLLDLLNSISSSISHVNQARVSLEHALRLMERSPAVGVESMREIKKHDHNSIKEFKGSSGGGEHKVEMNKINEKEWIFHEAMMVMKSSGFWVCGMVLLGGLKSEVEPMILEITNAVSMDSSLMALDSMFKKRIVEEGGMIVKEVEGVNECVRLIISSGIHDSDNGMELKRQLEEVGNGLKGLKEEEECVFESVMAARNEVLETLRRNNN